MPMSNDKPSNVNPEDDDDFSIIFSEQAAEKLKTAPPEVQAAMREIAANLRQAMHGLKEGRYKTFEDAVEAITGSRPERIELDDIHDDEEED